MKQENADAFGVDGNVYGGTAFLDGLQRLWTGNARARIVLVGHSTGAVYICHLLRHADARLPADVRFDIVFLAPGCTFPLLADTLAQHAGRIANVRLFG